MNASSAPTADTPFPLPTAQFKRFIAVFHIVFISGLVACLVLRWRRPTMTWSWQDAVLLGLVLLQVGLYLRFFLSPPGEPGHWRWWGAYFAASFSIWLAESRIEGSLDWVVWAYLGQMFGVLPPRMSIPASLLVFTTYFGTRIGLSRVAGWDAWDWFGVLSITAGASTMGLFLHRLATTSSERAKLIGELEAAKRQLERAREKEVELAALRERERLARDLHDSLGHGLVTLTVQLEAAQRLYPVDPARASALLEEMKQLTRRSMEQLRRSLEGLRAPGLGDRPLAGALRELCEQTAGRAALQVRCETGTAARELSPAVSEALWRVAQEGLANIEKHASARSARVALETRRQEVILRVSDDGAGLPGNAEHRPGHYGLRGLRERVEGLGGVFTATPNADRGTLLEARIPLAPDPQ
jgi:signal transduction histidine kinase